MAAQEIDPSTVELRRPPTAGNSIDDAQTDEIRPRSAESAWHPEDRRRLFDILPFPTVLPDSILPVEAEAVIDECGGLPLALAAAAGMVRNSGWADTQIAFARARFDAVATDWLPDSKQQNLAIVLAASVQVLPETERACFLECALWPEDVAVPLAALELFWSVHVPDAFDQRQIAKKLIAASVLQRGSEETLRLHDLYHGYLRHLAGKTLSARQGELADRCVRIAGAGCELIDASDWTLAHLPWHLVQGGRPAQVKALLLVFHWLASKLKVQGIQAVIAATQLVADSEVQQLGRVLRLSAHVLARDRSQLPGTRRLLADATINLPADTLIPRGGKDLAAPGALVATLAGHHWVHGALLLPGGRKALSWSAPPMLAWCCRPLP